MSWTAVLLVACTFKCRWTTADCDYIVCSYFPDAGRICLLNLDYANERKCILQQFGDKDFLTLAPGEFRIVDSVRLDPDEKRNVE